MLVGGPYYREIRETQNNDHGEQAASSKKECTQANRRIDRLITDEADNENSKNGNERQFSTTPPANLMRSIDSQLMPSWSLR